MQTDILKVCRAKYSYVQVELCLADHGCVILYYQVQTDPQWLQVGSDLSSMMARRKKADYNDELLNPSALWAEQQRYAQDTIPLIKKL